MTGFIRSFPWRVLANTAVVVTLSCSFPLVGGNAGQSEEGVETIVFIRHGEKPEGGFGQLNCRGLNRALSLPPIIAKSFGRPDAIYVPNPSHPKEDAGLNANSPFYNLTLALGMFIGRFFVVIPVLALAGSLAAQPVIPRSSGTLPTGGTLFVWFLLGVIVIAGGLTYLPAMALGPIVEHLRLVTGALS
jgi:hypothetical protein